MSHKTFVKLYKNKAPQAKGEEKKKQGAMVT
jgi:hypothetical protein